MNINLNICFMKKPFYLLVLCGFLFTAIGADAQFRSVPGVVTDSFKTRYPSAKSVSWSSKISGDFQATFTLDNESYTTRFSSKGEWQWSTKKITKDALPAPVKDGLAKSKYAGGEWEVKTVTMRFLPGSIVQYVISVKKSGLNQKNLLFSSEGQLLKDSTTL